MSTKSIHLLLIPLFFIHNTLAAQNRPTRYARANGLSMAYESFGNEKAETILLIQGIGAQLTAWPPELCRQLAVQGYHVIRFDNRDVGLSSKLDSLGMPDWASVIPLIGTCDKAPLPYSLEDLAKDAVGLLDALRIRRAHLVGASMGGAIAQLIAIHYPERALSLTSIMASSGNPKLPPGDPQVLKTMGTPPPQTNHTDSLAAYLVNIYKALSSPAYPTADSVLMQMARSAINRSWYPIGSARQAAAVLIGDNCDRRARLSHISVPTVVVHGENDPVVRLAAGKEVAATIPQAKFIAVPGMGHDLPMQLVPQLRDAILMATQNTLGKSKLK
jgi:pimeloyl-ACP methyl ester carboxylesterase